MISQEIVGRLGCPAYEPVSSNNENPAFRIKSGSHKDVEFSLSNMHIVEGGGEAMLRFDYDLITPILTEHQADLENTICAIVDDILHKTVELMNK